jgi:hypothetical protein
MVDARPGFPSADQIALAIVTACRLTGENNPIGTCLRQPSRARHIAFAALQVAFPDATQRTLARLCGYPTPAAGAANLFHARRARWWSEDPVDEVVGVLVDDSYGERAE